MHQHKVSTKKLEIFYNTSYMEHEINVHNTPELYRRLLTVRDFLREHKDVNKILDVGCSRGYLSKIIKNKQLYGIDISSELLKDVTGYKESRKASVLKIPYPDNFFELVICFQVVEHILEYKRALIELKRVSKKYILLSTDFVTKSDLAYSRDPFKNPHGHIHQFNLDNFISELKDMDFNVIKKEFHYPLLEYSTFKKTKGISNKILRFAMRKFNKFFNIILSKIYFNKVNKIFSGNLETIKLSNLEKFFALYGKLIDLEVEIALLLEKKK